MDGGTVFSETEMTAVAETSEALSSLMFEEAPAKLKETLGIATRRIAGGIATSVLRDPAGSWNRARGFGVIEPVTTDVVGQICDFYRAQNIAEAEIAIAPSLLPPDWDQICSKHGLSAGSSRLKLACQASEFQPGGSTRARVDRVGADQAGAAGRFLATEFGMQYTADLFGSAFRTGGFQAFAAWDGDEMIGVSVLRLGGVAAQFHGAVTKPAYRRQGVQSALLTARAQAARDVGSTWLISEVMSPVEGMPNSSLNNLLRAGFTVLYERRGWIWKSAP